MPKITEPVFGSPDLSTGGWYVETYAQACRAIRRAKNVFVQPRLGTTEVWVKISKESARELIDAVGKDKHASEIDTYGSMDPSHDFYIG